VKHTAQKPRREAEAKVKEEAEKQRLVEEKKKKNGWSTFNNSGTRC